MWAVSISSVRSPPGCFTYWMRRASKTMRKSPLIFTSLKMYPFIVFDLFFLFLCHSFPHATDETLLAKFKQQHQGNKYFVPTPVMEPAFVIQHFAGKVKYQVKVRIMSQDSLLFLLPPDWVYCKCIVLCYTWTGFSGKEHGPHAFGHRSVVEEQWQRVCAPTHWHGPGGHVSMGDSTSHHQRTGCFQWGGPGPGCQDVRCIIIFNLLAKWS